VRRRSSWVSRRSDENGGESSKVKDRTRILWLALGTGAAAVLLQLTILRHGIWFTPDSWAYWQGSVSLLHGDGYRFFFDLPINEWPPLYSVYLAAWQGWLGVCGETLRTSMVVSSGLAAAGWVVVLSLTMRAGPATIWSCVFLAAMFSTAARHLMSESLSNVLLPPLVGLAITASHAESRGRFLGLAALAGLLGGALLLTRNSCAAFLAASIVLLLGNRTHGLAMRLAVCALFGVAALVPTAISEAMSHKAWASPIGLGNGKYGPVEYLVQMTRGIGDPFGPQPVGVLAWLFVVGVGISWRVPDSSRSRLRGLVWFAAVATAALFVMFNLTHVFAEFKGRFLLFVPIATGAAVLMAAPFVADRRLRAAIMVLILAYPVGMAAKHVIHGRGLGESVGDVEALSEHFVRPDFTVDPGHVNLPPRRRDDGLLLVTPPLTSELESRLRSK
jgi:hypothetical protein